MPKITADFSRKQEKELRDFAKKHPVYNGNVSAVIREAVSNLLAREAVSK